jgi:hypothetical protein
MYNSIKHFNSNRLIITARRSVATLLTCLSILFLSCSNKIRISGYSKYNRIDHNWYQTYINDSA